MKFLIAFFSILVSNQGFASAQDVTCKVKIHSAQAEVFSINMKNLTFNKFFEVVREDGTETQYYISVTAYLERLRIIISGPSRIIVGQTHMGPVTIPDVLGSGSVKLAPGVELTVGSGTDSKTDPSIYDFANTISVTCNVL